MDYSAAMRFVRQKFGACYSTASFYTKITEWLDWYKGYVKTVHLVKCSNGLTTPTRELYRLKMAKRVCEDWASSLLNEDVTYVISGSTSDSSTFVQGKKGNGGVLGSNNFPDILSKALELMFALGTSALVLDLESVKVNIEDNKIVPDANTKIKINSYNALEIVPITYKNGVITEASFFTEVTISNKKHYIVSTHRKENGEYVIYNDLLDDQCRGVENTIGLIPVIRTGSVNPMFFILKTNIVNSVDLSSPMGVSIFDSALDVIKACDVIYDSCIREVISGQRIVMMNKNLLSTDDAGRPIVPQDVKQQYMQFFGDDATDVAEYIKEFAPSLNTASLDAELQNQLNMLSNKCGLGTRYYNFNLQSGVTATEYIGERNDFYRNVKKMTNSLELVLHNMVAEILFLGKFILGNNVNPNAKVSITVSDGVIESDEQKREQDRKDVEMGIMSKAEYRAKYYGETVEEAQKAIDKNNNSNVTE